MIRQYVEENFLNKCFRDDRWKADGQRPANAGKEYVLFSLPPRLLEKELAGRLLRLSDRNKKR